MTLTTYEELEQGTPEWLAARAGIITASVVGQLITKGSPDALAVDCPRCQAAAEESCISTARKVPTPIKTVHDERSSRASELPPVYKPAVTDTSRALTMTLTAERITGFVEQIHENADMLRGTLDEPYAREVYNDNIHDVTELGFMVRDDFGFRLGYSPDGLVGDDGLIEIKSRKQKKQLATILADAVPHENMAQLQCGLLVSGRDWIDYVSYCGGMPLFVKRVYPDPKWFTAIIEAGEAFEAASAQMVERYTEATAGLPQTERIDHFAEMEIF